MKKVFSGRNKVIAAALAAVLLMSPAEFSQGTLTVRADDNTQASVQNKIGKPFITDISNEYKGLKISWRAASGATGYYIFRKQKKSNPYELIATVSSDTLSYIDGDAMKEGGIYTYMIKGFDNDTVSEESESKTATRFPISKVKLKVKYAQSSARKMQKMINDFRTGKDTWLWNANNTQKVYTQGIGKLAYDYNLEKLAMIRAAEIAIKFNHERPNGKPCFSVLSDTGYNFKYAGENIAYGYKTAAKAFDAFLEMNNYYSGQGHRRNMLSTNYNVCAIGHCKVNGVHYWVQLFAFTEDDSDYTKTISTTKNVTMYVSSDDLTSYKKTLKALGAKVEDYAPSRVTWGEIEASKKFATLNYTKSVGATGYEIYRSTSKKNGYKKIVTVTNQQKLVYVDKKLARKRKYYYYIVPYRMAHDEKVYGKKSEIKMIKTN
ncbi:CAP domain-containing protein [Butyrivibrio sp. AE3004]|uniref:CAP domain-containing protein n=1 Tax=Butyrivibrio sp. AE3004 TaxID=1506994 RepID=UPI00069013EB|nr:CAP domain-containing protein [Butyrivibrio sp. AE3004]